MLRRSVMFAVAAGALGAAGCSGSPSVTLPRTGATATPTPGATATPTATPSPGTPTPTPTPGGSAPTIIVVGAQHTFTGSDTTTVAFANGTSSNGAATFAETRTFENAQAGAPAAYDVHDVVNFTVTSPATTGTQTLSAVSDFFDNQTMSGATTTVSEAAEKSVTTANDVTAANDAGGGPYTLTTTATTTFPSAYTLGVYPPATGSSIAEPLALSIASSATDEAANGATPAPSAYPYVTSEKVAFANDGSFQIDPRTYSNGVSRVITENPNGTAHEADTNTSFALSIGLPSASGGSYQIPVTYTSPTSGNTSTFEAADWYPGNALPTSPLGATTLVVKGPAATLPAACQGALSEPNLVEIDTNSTLLDVYESYETIAERDFVSNGIIDCVTRTTVKNVYTTTTGALASTSTETFAQILTGVTTPNARATVRSRR